MKYIGAHVSAAGGVENAPVNAHKLTSSPSQVAGGFLSGCYFLTISQWFLFRHRFQ